MLLADWENTGYYGDKTYYRAFGYWSSISVRPSPRDNPECDVTPLFNNSDTSKYHEYNGTKIYNSAIGYWDNKLYVCVVAEQSGYCAQINKNNPSSSWYSFMDQINTLRGTLYSTSSSPLNRYTNCTALYESDLPIFYTLQEWHNYVTNPYVPPVIPITSNGGGATHIAKVTGQLSSLSNNLSDILMVSGGGGGGLILGENTYVGKDAGGISGSGDNSADQTTGYAFGQGESADGVSGGGGGLYGGYKGVNN